MGRKIENNCVGCEIQGCKCERGPDQYGYVSLSYYLSINLDDGSIKVRRNQFCSPPDWDHKFDAKFCPLCGRRFR